MGSALVQVKTDTTDRTADEMVVDSFKILDTNYGKSGVRILHVTKQGLHHSIRELEVETKLTLNSTKDFETGNNEDIIATDSQKNTVYVLAKQYGIGTAEEFGLLLATHFLTKYPWVVKAEILLDTHPWQRINDEQGRPHNHAFISSPVMNRHAKVVMCRGQAPVVSSGISNLRILKTTQTSFENFVQDEFRTLPDAKDRLLSTVVSADWTYSRIVDFDQAFDTVKSCILKGFAGPADVGVFSSSVQYTQHTTQQDILRQIPEVETITISMPNAHYFNFDFSKFGQLRGQLSKPGLGDVYYPVDKPSGMIVSTLGREQISKL